MRHSRTLISDYRLSSLLLAVPAPLAAATGFGVLTAIGFALNPLARAQAIPVAGLFRDSLVSKKTTLPFWVMYLYAVCLLGLVLISFLVVRYIEITFWFLAGVTASYLILRISAGIVLVGPDTISG